MKNNVENWLETQMALLNSQLMNLSLTVEYLYHRLDTLGIDVDAQGFQSWAENRMKELAELMKNEDIMKELGKAYENLPAFSSGNSDESEE